MAVDGRRPSACSSTNVSHPGAPVAGGTNPWREIIDTCATQAITDESPSQKRKHPFRMQASAESFSLTLTAGDGFRGKATMAMDASLQGVDPLWGTFKLEYGGEVTRPLNVDATAGRDTVSGGRGVLYIDCECVRDFAVW